MVPFCIIDIKNCNHFHFGLANETCLHCKWKKMDDMKVMFVFIRVMLADVSYVPVNESYHYKMAFGLCAWKQT